MFVWQFLSWAITPVHQSEMKYSANQDKIMEALNQNLSEDGAYFLPGVPPGTSNEAAQAAGEANMGKPWAQISYHKSMDMSMGMNMFRGLVVDLLAAWLLVWLLMQFRDLNMMSALKASVIVGIISYLTIPYLNSIWFESNSMGHLVDAFVSWTLVGAWMGWWLTRRD